MSAFIVDTECMHRVVKGCDMMSPGVFNDMFRSTVGRDLFKLNVEAVRQRYGSADDMVPEGWQPEDYTYREPPAVVGCPPMVDSLKAIHCLIYQCSEGDVPEHFMYKMLVSVADKLEAAIRAEYGVEGDIEDMRAYQLAAW